jgi:hypothetical protein
MGGEENHDGCVLQHRGLIGERIYRAAIAGEPAFRRCQQVYIGVRRLGVSKAPALLRSGLVETHSLRPGSATVRSKALIGIF